MKNLLILVSFFYSSVILGQESRIIFGRIMDGNTPLQDVRIHGGDETKPVFTDAEGTYSIEAVPGDVLHYSYTGMKEYRVRVEDVTKFLNLVMIPDVQELDEVTVSKKRKKSQRELTFEYRSNPNLIRTAYGIIDTRTAPGQVRMVSGDEIMPIGLNILDVINRRFPGVFAVGDYQRGGYIASRGMGSISGPNAMIYDVDGQIFTTAPIWLDVNNIKRMAVIPSLAFVARYGAIGGGGVIVINTTSGQATMPISGDLARLRNNYVKEDIPTNEDLVEDEPTYLNALTAATQLEDAVSIYEKYEVTYAALPHFFMDAFAYFASRSDGEEMAAKILKENLDKISGNPVLMKGFAYMLEEHGRNKEALELYKEVFILRPHYSQSYLDMARSYRSIGEIGKSAAMFARYKYLLEEGFLTTSKKFGKILQHESDNLLALEGKDIGRRVRNILTDPYVDGATRVVFEWNDSEAEFELQFVNPGGQYYTWKHTYADSAEQITDEKDNTYSISEYIIDANLPGTWTVNSKYLGNKSLTPTYLKVTVYTSYGERSQAKEVRQFKLFLKDVNKRLFNFENPSRTIVR